MMINPETLFNVLITIILLNFLKDSILDYLNSTYFNNEIPKIISDIYDNEKYLKSQEYKKIQSVSVVFTDLDDKIKKFCNNIYDDLLHLKKVRNER